MMADPSIGSFSCRSLVRVLPLNSICHQWKTERKSVMGGLQGVGGARWVCLLHTRYLWPAQQICVSLLLELLLILATMKHLISSSSKTVWVQRKGIPVLGGLLVDALGQQFPVLCSTQWISRLGEALKRPLMREVSFCWKGQTPVSFFIGNTQFHLPSVLVHID